MKRLSRSIPRSLFAAGLTFSTLFMALPVHGVDVTLDYTVRYQEIEGIGSSTRYEDVYMRMPEHQDYYVEEFGASMYRVFLPYAAMPAPDESLAPEDITWEMFDLDGLDYWLEIPVGLKTRHPDLRLIGCFWSPPAWMKVNNDVNGTTALPNRLREDREDHYAYFLAAVIELMRDHYNAPLYSLSIQNELLFDQFYPSAVWTPEQYYRVTRKLSEILEERDIDIILHGPDHMSTRSDQTRDFLSPIYADPLTRKYFRVTATHGYTDGINPDTATFAQLEIHRRHVVEPYQHRWWMTETSGHPHSWEGALDGVALSMHHSFVHGNAAAYVYWLANHEGRLHVEELFDEMQPQNKSRVFQHFSAYVRPGARRIHSSDVSDELLHVSAFVHEENKTVTSVMLNLSEAPIEVNLKFLDNPGVSSLNVIRTSDDPQYHLHDEGSISVSGSGEATYTVPARSIVTLYGDAAGPFEYPTFEFSQTHWQVPSRGATATTQEFSVRVTPSDPEARWTTRSLSTVSPIGIARRPFITLPEDIENTIITGEAELSFTVAFNRGDTHTGYLLVADQMLQITQTSSADDPPPSIFTPPDTADYGNGIKWNPLGFFYDQQFPYVYFWSIDSWIYIWADGASEEDGFYFYDYNINGWCWTAQAVYPYIYVFTSEDSGHWTPLHEL